MHPVEYDVISHAVVMNSSLLAKEDDREYVLGVIKRMTWIPPALSSRSPSSFHGQSGDKGEMSIDQICSLTCDNLLSEPAEKEGSSSATNLII